MLATSGCAASSPKSDGEPADKTVALVRGCAVFDARDVHLPDFMRCCGLKSIRKQTREGFFSTATPCLGVAREHW
jgi:hypothetical protein